MLCPEMPRKVLELNSTERVSRIAAFFRLVYNLIPILLLPLGVLVGSCILSHSPFEPDAAAGMSALPAPLFFIHSHREKILKE